MTYNPSGAITRFETLDTAGNTGGNDTIVTGDGDNTVLGGAGADHITTALGTDTILGDNGSVQLDATGSLFSLIQSTDLLVGDADVILGGAGTKRIIGGYGADSITVLAGDHFIIGDAGAVTYSAAGDAVLYETLGSTASTGGDDSISTGAGDNTILGGMGADPITTGTGVDTILGDNGSVAMDATGTLFARIDSTEIALGGNDTIVSGTATRTWWAATARTRSLSPRATTSSWATTGR